MASHDEHRDRTCSASLRTTQMLQAVVEATATVSPTTTVALLVPPFTGSAPIDAVLVTALVTAVGWIVLFLTNRANQAALLRSQQEMARDQQAAAAALQQSLLERQQAHQLALSQAEHRQRLELEKERSA